MTDDSTRLNPAAGMQVHGSEGDHIGQIDRFENDIMVVDLGLMKGETRIPVSLISRIERDIAVLRTTSEEATSRDWIAAEQNQTMTVSGFPTEDRPDALTEVSTTAKPGRDTVVDADTDHFDDRPDMDTNRRPDDTRYYRPRK